MSDDISELVRRLRYEAAHWYEELSARLMLQAADTLERLQAVIDRGAKLVNELENENDALRARAEQAEAQRDELRKLLAEARYNEVANER